MHTDRPLRRPLVSRLLVLGVFAFAALLAVWGVLAQPRQSAPPRAELGGMEAGQGGADEKGQPMATDPAWQEVDRLIQEQKMQAALEKVAEILAAARAADDAEQTTRALIRRVQLTTALHSYETAVRELRAAVWPEEPTYHSILSLFYGQSLMQYLDAYSWEIRQRERIETGEEVDLKAWTQERIVAEAQAAYAEVWERRDAWGAESIGILAEYIEQNNYPARIRGTLRDAVTYLWAEMLANTSYWSPEQSQELYRLSLDELLAPMGLRLGAEELASPEVHPLTKIAALLGDLETWHHRHQRPEAAFEARRARIGHLAAAFEQEEDLARLRENLEQHLEGLGRRYPWWSTGRVTLADMVRSTDAPDALIEARRIAVEAAEAHPESIGGQQARALVAQIEAPSYQLTAMASDGPGHRSLAVEHKNLGALHFRAYAVDLIARVSAARDYNLLPGHQEILEILQGVPAAEWRLELPPTPDYRTHRTYDTPPFEAPGLYVIVASPRADFQDAANLKTAVNFILTDLVILPRQQPDAGYEVSVRSGESGEGVAGARVDLWQHNWQKGHRRVASATTGPDGEATFERRRDRQNSYFLTALKGEQMALYTGGLGFHEYGRENRIDSALIFTDRSVYRPQQEVLWKVVAYEGSYQQGEFEVRPRASGTVMLRDANGEEVASAEIKTNAYGSASGKFAIPAGRLLGDWSLYTSLNGHTSVQVEEYKRPTFEVTVEDPEGDLRLNREVTLEGSVRYYFGLPVSDGEVRWRVTREPVYPLWWGWWGRPTQPPRVIAAGQTELGADGTFQVTFTPEADEREAAPAEGSAGGRGSRITEPPGGGVTYRYRMAADVTGEGGETRSASRVFRLGFVAVDAVLTTDGGFFLAGEDGPEILVRRTNLDGVARPGQGSWRLVTLVGPDEALLPAEQPLPPSPDPDAYQTPGDRLRPRWAEGGEPEAILRQWEDGREIATGTLSHGEDGTATAELPALPAGAYRFHYRTEDEHGAVFTARREILVAADGAPAPELPAVLEVQRDTTRVGEVARLLVASGLPDQEMLLTLFRNGEPIREHKLRSNDGMQVIEIPITAEERGGFGARLDVLRDYQLMSQMAQVQVPWDDRRLAVEFATFRDRLRPGQTETWRVTVRGKEEAGSSEAALGAGAAELLAYMYDRSLDFFAPHNPPSPIDLYPTRLGTPGAPSSLGVAQIVWRSARPWFELPSAPRLINDRLTFFDAYGIGGPGRRGMLQRMAIPSAPQEAMAISVSAESPLLDAVPTENLESLGYMSGDASAKQAAAPPPPGQGGDGSPSEEPVQVRENFAETAFWEPHLITGEDGSVSFEFTVPDSVTEWNVWVHALTKDLRSGSVSRQVATVKELLVRPYLPRFLREGDQAELKVVVNNAGEVPLAGELRFEIFDPETDESLLDAFGLAAEATRRSFAVEPQGGTSLTFPIRVPPAVGTIAIRAVGRASAANRAGGDTFSDGELRPLPVLPGRYHLAQSRFVTLRDGERREMTFPDMRAGVRGDDPTLLHDQLVVTVDAQLFYGVLSALPYLVEYPYECTEQSLNRFLSTGIVTRLYDDYPAVAKMAKELSKRETPLKAFDAPDPNRKMLLEETPWLVRAQGGKTPEGAELLNVLDPQRAAAVRVKALGELRKAQTSIGGFPWWPGGPPSPYMTLYILYGFSKGLDHGVEVPQDMVVQAWSYMHRHYLDEMARRLVEKVSGWELVTFLNYVLSNYPDDSWTGGVFTADERRLMLEHSFRHWKQHSPLLKGYLALTLARAGRQEDARLVFDSVMDSAKTEEDLGTYWAPEDRAWLWYNDTIETHAFTLKVLTELEPDDARRHGLVQWLFLNKKLNHWKSTRATAEVIDALIHYLDHEGGLGQREAVRVAAGAVERTFVFEPDAYTGAKNQLVIPGDEIDPATMSTVVAEKKVVGNAPGPNLAFASATWHFSTEQLPPEARGDFFSVERRFFRRLQKDGEWVLQPLAEGARLEVGDQVEVQLSLRAKHAAEYVHLRDPRGAGFEPETVTSGYQWDLGIGWYEEVRDSGTNFFFEWLPAGEHTFKYRLRATLAGAFKAGPATVQSMYAPEFNAYSAGALLRIEGD